MSTDLEIKVLFCYSPQVLRDTYNDLQELKTDNANLCLATENIFARNISRAKYKVKVLDVGSVEVATLQKRFNTTYRCLSKEQVSSLVRGLATNASYVVPKYGNLRRHLLILKNVYGATIVVLQVKLCKKLGIFHILGVAGKIDIQNSSEAFVGIARDRSTLNKTNVSEMFWVLNHEFGHLMGCRHPYGTGRGFDNTAGNNHGHCCINATTGRIECGTLMSYAYPPVLYYSNPNLFDYKPPHENEPCGVVGESEAYLTVNANVPKLAGIFTP